MKLNNKGFAISGILYTSLILFLMLLLGILGIVAGRKIILDKEKTEIMNELNGDIDINEMVYTDYNVLKGVNAPKLSSGMTPIKWNGTSWEVTSKNDDEWYDYYNKKWANVKTADGSFWVWIPRYAYSITSGYHTSTAGTIDVKFLIDNTNLTNDGTTIEAIPTYSGNSQTNYVAHPAFTFGDTEITGMWVAKFEPSVADHNDLCYTSPSETNCNKTTLVPKIIPNVYSWRYITISNSFDVALAMKNNLIYGWNSTEINTHIMKNNEWGATIYLSNSVYGKEDEIWINPANDYTTGCAGLTSSSEPTVGCINAYDSPNGVNASTTGNIYGIYDMSGGAWERTASYVDNGNINLTIYGLSIINADNKYKNIYALGTSDTRSDIYETNSNIFGDAVYEISSTYEGFNAWYNDYSYMVVAGGPWFARSGSYIDSNAGQYTFYSNGGGAYIGNLSRPVVLVGEGL